MDIRKTTEIEEMANICIKNQDWSTHQQGFCYSQAEALLRNGFGNVKNGVKEYMDKELIYVAQLRRDITKLTQGDSKLQAVLDSILSPIQNHMLNTYKELYGEEQNSD